MPEMTTQELQIVEKAIAALKKASGASIKRKSITGKPADDRPDMIFEINLRQIRQELFVEIKNEVRKHMVEDLIHKIGSQKDNWLIVARYIPAPIKEFLQNHGYNYLEMTGNCFISTGSLFISINDKPVKQVLKTPEGKLWKAAGLKFLLVILQDPLILVQTQREIAHTAGIALGNISNLLEELREGGFLVSNDEGEQLQQREKLIERWVEAFHITLRPKLQKGRFRFASSDQQKSWRKAQVAGVYWGGEPGADLYTDFLVPEKFTLYTSRSTVELMMNLKMIPDKNGNIIVLDKFWNDWNAEKNVPNAAPLLLVYAELKNSLDSRSWEVAERIKKMLLNAN